MFCTILRDAISYEIVPQDEGSIISKWTLSRLLLRLSPAVVQYPFGVAVRL